MSDVVNIKDKLVTVEAMNELHNYSKNSYAKIDYVNEKFESFAPKLESNHLPLLVAETDGQTEFTISFDTFNIATDTVLVWSGRTYLHQNSDYTINGNIITLIEGVPKDTTIAIVLLRIIIS